MTNTDWAIRTFAGWDPSALRLEFDGARLEGHRTATEAELADGDIIDVVIDQCGS